MLPHTGAVLCLTSVYEICFVSDRLSVLLLKRTASSQSFGFSSVIHIIERCIDAVTPWLHCLGLHIFHISKVVLVVIQDIVVERLEGRSVDFAIVNTCVFDRITLGVTVAIQFVAGVAVRGRVDKVIQSKFKALNNELKKGFKMSC